MSFFKKLKDRMFKSASKIDEGLDAIIEEGAATPVADLAEAQAPAPIRDKNPDPIATSVEEPEPEPEPEVAPAP